MTAGNRSDGTRALFETRPVWSALAVMALPTIASLHGVLSRLRAAHHSAVYFRVKNRGARNCISSGKMPGHTVYVSELQHGKLHAGY